MENSFQLKKLGRLFRSARVNRGLTQAVVSQLAGVSRLTVIRIEEGADSVAIRSHSKVAQVLGMNLSLVPFVRPTLEELQEMQ